MRREARCLPKDVCCTVWWQASTSHLSSRLTDKASGKLLIIFILSYLFVLPTSVLRIPKTHNRTSLQLWHAHVLHFCSFCKPTFSGATREWDALYISISLSGGLSGAVLYSALRRISTAQWQRLPSNAHSAVAALAAMLTEGGKGCLCFLPLQVSLAHVKLYGTKQTSSQTLRPQVKHIGWLTLSLDPSKLLISLTWKINRESVRQATYTSQTPNTIFNLQLYIYIYIYIYICTTHSYFTPILRTRNFRLGSAITARYQTDTIIK
jgi:hypothetical protein